MSNSEPHTKAPTSATSMYFVAIVLPPALNEQVLQWKHFFQDRFGCTVALKSPAHITLVPPYWMPPSAEPQLVAAIEEFAQQQSPFTLTTQGFSAFKPRTIFAAVQHSDALQQLKLALHAVLTGHPKLNTKKEGRPFHPHITLATRDLKPHHFFEAWPLFEKKEWITSWPVTALSILKHNGRHWDVWYQAPFKGLNI